MKKVIIILSIILNVVTIVLMINLFRLSVNNEPDCSTAWLLMAMVFFYLPIAIFISVISYAVHRFSKNNLIKKISLVILVLVFIFEIVYVVLRIQVSNSDYVCPEIMRINYEEIL